MTNNTIMIDLTNNRKRYKINVCYYCDHDKFPRGRPIMPDDKNVQKQPDGTYKCGYCVGEDAKKLLSSVGDD